MLSLNAITACSTSRPVKVTPPPVVKSELPEISESETDTTRNLILLDTIKLGSFFFPVNGKVISHYGRRGSRMHTGTDIKLSRGDTVKAAFKGVVTKANTYYGYGILVVLKHPDHLETYYAHLSKALVNIGDTILSGEPLGLGGRTGRATTEHLHFEIRSHGKALNPEHFFNFNDRNIKTFVFERKKQTAPEKVSVVQSNDIVYYTVKQGDTLYAISRKYGTSVNALCQLNNLKKTSVLKIGRKLRVK
ncbi:MAG: peptidoglycan DD-metalloendopeptidase family protein [Bacteroidetes bacterium]|nr:peptidoglycan DD-metalloendopeptidase family protein [Bacteroidales bacterium]NJO68716.1 peptidoglycan DD-metalloendopeptidase family protein [Bacteroidota bacterium]